MTETKDRAILFFAEQKLKEDFRIACGHYKMSQVLRQLMQEYVNKTSFKNGNGGELCQTES